jgi:tellurite resistance protein TerC
MPPVLDVSLVAWAATIALVLGLLALDLTATSGGRAHVVGFREAVAWSLFYIGVAVGFGIVFGMLAGWDYGTEYFAGYIVEKSLSVDNLFVFVIIMATFAVPPEHQQRVLTFGIIVALILRAIFIALGAALLAAFSFMFLLFGLLLLFTAVQLFRHRDEDPTIEDNKIVAFARRRFSITPDYVGGKIVTKIDGKRWLTPMFLVLLTIGTTDLLFALDSIPAVFGVTEEAYIVFTANAFALLGLRALYFLVSGLLDRLVYLSTGLALILAFIGGKLVLHYAHLQNNDIPEVSTNQSLVVIAVILTVTTVLSLLKSKRDPTARAHAGTLRDPKKKPREG